MPDFVLLIPFLSGSPEFARGVEIGILFQRMSVEYEICDYVQRNNQEQVLLMAKRLGWEVNRIALEGDEYWIEMKKGEFDNEVCDES